MQVLGQGCRVIAPDDDELMTVGTRKYRMPINRARGANQMAQTISQYEPGLAPARRNATSEEVLYVTAGTGVAYIDGYAYELRPGAALYIPPGSQYQIENRAAAELEIVSVCCPEEMSVEIHPGPVAVATGAGPRLMVHESEREAIQTGDRTFRVLADSELGCQQVTQFIGVIPPGRAPQHYHPYEEAIYILAGQGLVWVDEASREFAAGTSIYLPPDQRHALENTGTTEVRLLGVFYPAGSPATRYEE